MDGLAVDKEGDDLPDAGGLRNYVEATARDLIRHARLAAIPDWRTCIFEVTDETGSRVLTLPFSKVALAGVGSHPPPGCPSPGSSLGQFCNSLRTGDLTRLIGQI